MSARKKSHGKKKTKVSAPETVSERSLSEVVAGVVQDGFIASGLSMDAEVFQNKFSVTAAMRDAWMTNPYFAKYRELLASNVYGENGIMLRSKIKETEDRVVYSADEKWSLVAHERRINRIVKWASEQSGRALEHYNAYKLAEGLSKAKPDDIIRGQALIEVGAPDVFANQRVEKGWTEWQRAENCDVRGRRTYNMLRQIRLWSAARDGGHFIRLIRDTRVNQFGFALQQVNDEWCDYWYNVNELANGNTVRLGIEYPQTSWGIGKPLAFHFIKRIPRDWQTSARYGGMNSYAQRDSIPAEEIIHYARFVDSESTRPAPWGVSILGKVRHLDQYEIAAVVAARAEACKTGWLYSDLVPEGGVQVGKIPTADTMRTTANSIKITPGGLYGLPYGVKFQANDPTHPSGNFADFRKGMGQAACAGLPGADYNVMFNDLNMSFSSGRIGRLDTFEASKILQRWDIETAERPIFEAWLEMALITGALGLPFSKAKFTKFNNPQFSGRRWKGSDEVKDATAAALRVANHLSSLGRECAEEGFDFEEICFERAEEIMLQQSLGINPALTVQDATTAAGQTPADETQTDSPGDGNTEGEPVEITGNNGNGKKMKIAKAKARR